jgi:pilus assembly protein Flp/PilA
MKKMLNIAKRFVQEEDAPTMVEYGLLVAVIALVVVVGATVFGNALSALFSRLATLLGGYGN